MRYSGVGILLLTVAACSTDQLSNVENGLVIYPSQQTAQPGDTIQIRLINWSGHDLQENLCQLALQQKQGSTWALVYAEPVAGAACPLYLRGFPHGSARTRPLHLPADLEHGEYRIIFRGLGIEDGPALPEETRTSESFMIAP